MQVREDLTATMRPQPGSSTEDQHHAVHNPNGLTELHLAVISNDRAAVRSIMATRERGVDERTSAGATSLMLACLFGRATIFRYLITKKASAVKRDRRGLGLLEYAKHVPLVQESLARYQEATGQEPSQKGREVILTVLRVCIEAARNEKRPEIADLPTQIRSGVEVGVQTQIGSDSEIVAGPSAERTAMNDLTTVFFRDGQELRVGRVRIEKTVTYEVDIGRKSCAVIRGKADFDYRMVAVSGWRYKGDGILCGATYSSLVRRLCRDYNLELPSFMFDYKFRGDPAETTGAYFSCHAEKLLAVWLLEEAVSHVSRTRHLTKENIDKVKRCVAQLPSHLQQAVIELDHEPCKSCLEFLDLVYQEAGLHIEWQHREWFVRGERPSLMPYKGDLDRSMESGGSRAVLEDEIDEGLSSLSIDAHQQQQDSFREATPHQGPESIDNLQHLNPVTKEPGRAQKLRLANQASLPMRQYPKHASPVWEWPLPAVQHMNKTMRRISSRHRPSLRSVKAARRFAHTGGRSTALQRDRVQQKQDLLSPMVPTTGAVSLEASGHMDTSTSPESSGQEKQAANSSQHEASDTVDLTAGEYERCPTPEVLDPSILDELVPEPFPGAFSATWSYHP